MQLPGDPDSKLVADLEKEKQQQSCKPGSVSVHHGSLSFIWTCRHRQVLTAYPPGSGGQPSIPGIFGLSTHKVYPRRMSPHSVVSPYLTFSPLPRLRRDGYFLWHSLLNCGFPQSTFPLGSMAPCVARTFLRGINTSATRRTVAVAKIKKQEQQSIVNSQ